MATSEWRNRQTRQPKELVPARAWGFKSPLRHQVHNQVRETICEVQNAASRGGVLRLWVSNAGNLIGEQDTRAFLIKADTEQAVELAVSHSHPRQP